MEAFRFDGRSDLASRLAEPSFGLRDLVATLEGERECSDPFEKMRQDLEEASTRIENDRPQHWKEVIDDLVYCLNFHAELLPAEDHLTLTSVLMPFQMNVIAALPLPSARILLAFREAGILNLMAGHVEIERSCEASATTRVLLKNGEETLSIEYPLFVDCSGQKPTSPEHFPCPSLVRSGAIRPARTRFAEVGGPGDFREKGLSHRLAERDGEIVYLTGGIDIDAAYHLISREGIPNPRLFNVSFAHGMGVRPYSYGLQACDATAAMLVEAWLESVESNVIVSDVVQVSNTYATV